MTRMSQPLGGRAELGAGAQTGTYIPHVELATGPIAERRDPGLARLLNRRVVQVPIWMVAVLLTVSWLLYGINLRQRALTWHEMFVAGVAKQMVREGGCSE